MHPSTSACFPAATKASSCKVSIPRRFSRLPTIQAGLPGYSPFVRGARPLGKALAGWDIRQEHAHPNPAVANAQVIEDLDGGVTSIELRLDAAAMQGLDADDRRAAELTGRDGVSVSSVADIERLVQGVKLNIAGFHFDSGAAFIPAASLYVAAARHAGVPLTKLLGGFNADPLRVLARDGHLAVPLDTALQQMADLATWTAQHAPRMTAVEVCIDAVSQRRRVCRRRCRVRSGHRARLSPGADRRRARCRRPQRARSLSA